MHRVADLLVMITNTVERHRTDGRLRPGGNGGSPLEPEWEWFAASFLPRSVRATSARPVTAANYRLPNLRDVRISSDAVVNRSRKRLSAEPSDKLSEQPLDRPLPAEVPIESQATEELEPLPRAEEVVPAPNLTDEAVQASESTEDALPLSEITEPDQAETEAEEATDEQLEPAQAVPVRVLPSHEPKRRPKRDDDKSPPPPPPPKPLKVIRRRREEEPKVFETPPKTVPEAMLHGVPTTPDETE